MDGFGKLVGPFLRVVAADYDNDRRARDRALDQMIAAAKAVKAEKPPRIPKSFRAPLPIGFIPTLTPKRRKRS